MDEVVNTKLSELVAQVRAMTDKANRVKGKEAERLQAELSSLLEKQIPALMVQGLSVAEIQNALRTAIDVVPQTYAPDADTEDDESAHASDEISYLPVSEVAEVTYFLPMDEADISAFSAGEIESTELMELICELPDITLIEMADGLDLVLTDFGKTLAMEDIAGGGEIVAGADGEAFMPEYLDVTEADGYSFLVCEPMVFKSTAEVKAVAALLAPIDETAFRKKADIKKLLKSGWLSGYDKRSVKKEKDYIIGALWEECALLSEVYRIAAHNHCGMAIFAGYPKVTL